MYTATNSNGSVKFSSDSLEDVLSFVADNGNGETYTLDYKGTHLTIRQKVEFVPRAIPGGGGKL